MVEQQGAGNGLNLNEAPQDNINVNNIHNIAATSVKLPPFWSANPDLWFRQVEAQFTLSGITADSTKYNYIIAGLPTEHLRHIIDIVSNPPTSNRYNELKTSLINRLSASEEARLSELLSPSEMGDNSPSSFYREMIAVAGNTINPDLVFKLWLRKIPRTIAVSLASLNEMNLSTKLNTADRVWETLRPSNVQGEYSVASVTPATNNFHQNSLENEIKLLRAQVEALKVSVNTYSDLREEVFSLKSHVRGLLPDSNYYFSRNRNRSNTRNNFYRSTSRDAQVCQYHRRYGINARNCAGTWCTMYKQNNPSPSLN